MSSMRSASARCVSISEGGNHGSPKIRGTHDNTATDIALLRVGPDRVRSLIAAEGLETTLIPDSTRRFYSYNVGAPLGVDIGWSGVKKVMKSGHSLGPPRAPLNHKVTLAS